MRPIRLFTGILLAVSSSTPGWAQTSVGEIFGKVTDESGAVLPGVSVTLESPALIQPRTTVTSNRGAYQVPSLPIGTYRVHFAIAGFSKVIREGVRVETGFNAEVNGRLKVSSVEETITVSGDAPVIEGEVTAWVMRRIARTKGETIDPHGDKEYTDWPRLAAILTEWQAGLSP